MIRDSGRNILAGARIARYWTGDARVWETWSLTERTFWASLFHAEHTEDDSDYIRLAEWEASCR